jgi:hypothetical protein
MYIHELSARFQVCEGRAVEFIIELYQSTSPPEDPGPRQTHRFR